MLVSVNVFALTETKWYQYAVRFALGGGVTVLAGLVANRFGPSVGGLFLAFPAIFPASASLIEKHERQRKEERGLQGALRARQAVMADASGATMGSIALIAFACCAWKMFSNHNAWWAILFATFVWIVVSISVWYGWKHHFLGF